MILEMTTKLKDISQTFATEGHKIIKFLFSTEEKNYENWVSNLDYFQDSGVELYEQILISFARNGNAKIFNDIIQKCSIPPSYQTLELLLRNIKNYTADNVLILHELKSSFLCNNNNDADSLITEHILNYIIPNMPHTELTMLKDQNIIDYNISILEREYSLIEEDMVLLGGN